jgi:hypothetical protein
MRVVEDLNPPYPPHQTKAHGHPEVTPTSRALGFISDEMLDYVDALMDGTTNMAGARRLLMITFALSGDRAGEVVAYWRYLAARG